MIDALNRDMPFDEFTIEQIAGDMLPNATEAQRIATGFHRNTQFNEEGGVDKDESYFETQVDRVATTGTVWLGSTIGCAQCHDHKFDPFTQRDFYSMMAFFNNVDKHEFDNGETPVYIEPVLEMPTPEQKTRREALEARIQKLTDQTETMSPAIKAEQAAWEKSVLEAERGWRVLTPSKMTAAAGTSLTADAQGTIFANGEMPRNEAYTIEAELPVRAATGIRLEALPNSKLPRGGPGRDPYGNFNITQIKLEIPDGTDWKQVGIKKITADTGSRSLDRKRGQVWMVDATRDDVRLERQLVLVPEEPIASAKVRIILVQESEFSCQSVGYFRLSATDASEPAAVVSVSFSLRALLGKTGRAEEQEKKLSDYFLSVAPSLQAARDELKEARDEEKKLDIASTLIMRDRQSFERPFDFVRIRGGFSAKADKVYANVPAVLPPLPESEMPNRLGLARWLASKDNPLTARVEVNRIWEQFFGHGIVETSEDFGTQGQRPSHPELLDWLATEFMDRGWSMKAMDRLIVTSTVYRQSSKVTPELLAQDQYNRLLARGPRFRMEAEMVRDTVLAASGLLSSKIGGPSVFPPQPPGIWDMPYNDDVYVESQGEDRYRRGIYTFARRSAPYPSLINFDAPSREVCTVRRTRTNTPLQALNLLNDQAFWEAARAMAARLEKEGGPDARSRIDYGYRLATGRHARPEELDYLTKYEIQEQERFATHADGRRKSRRQPRGRRHGPWWRTCCSTSTRRSRRSDKAMTEDQRRLLDVHAASLFSASPDSVSAARLGGIAHSVSSRRRSREAPTLAPWLPSGRTFPRSAKNIIYLFMAGGPSQLDLFDYKPALTKFDGQPVPEELIKGERFAFIKGIPKLLGSPHHFAKYGQSGAELSVPLPHLAKIVDDVAIVKSLHTTQFNHAPAQIFMSTGHQIAGRPSMGAWVTYGIGSECADLPGFVVMLSGRESARWRPVVLGQWFPAVRLPGRGVPALRRPGTVPFESRGSDRRDAPALARRACGF